MAEADEDVDGGLYADMEDTKPTAVKISRLPSNTTKQLQQQHRHPKPLTEHVQELQQRVDVLEQENENLQRNMGTLYRTAMAELKRKDAQILELQEQLEAAAATRTTTHR